MNANLLRSFALGLMSATAVCGAVYFLGPDDTKKSEAPKEVVKEELTEEEMKNKLLDSGYVVLTKEELQTQIEDAKASQETPAEKKEEEGVYNTVITITPGMTTGDVADALINANIIKNKQYFVKAVERKGLVQKLRPGAYEVNSNMALEELLATIYK
ncbi:MAG: aminodeoxychorismate lyase [Bacillus sp. (in: firmicutes)]